MSWAKYSVLAAMLLLGGLGLLVAYIGGTLYIEHHYSPMAAVIFSFGIVILCCAALIGYVEAKRLYK